ncbi:MAG: glycosyltransferase family 2 protein, partial [Acidobacteriota bacterium]
RRFVSVVLVTWNSAPFLRRCLESLARQTWPELEIISVDNASSDTSAAIVRSGFPDCHQILNESNRGFTGAVNQGITAARGEFVFLCNPDATLEPDYIARVVEALDLAGPSFGAGTGRLMRATGIEIEPTKFVDSKGIRMTRSGRHLDIGQGLPDGAGDRGLRPLEYGFEVFGVSGAAALYRMAFLRDAAVGGEVLDEDFHTYREDADLAWRGRVLGWRALYVPDAVGYHVRTVTPQKRRELRPIVNMHSVKNRFLLRLKNESVYLAIRNAPFEIPRDLLAIAAVLTIERTSLPALSWLWRNRARVLAKRREIQRRRRVSDRELAGWFR